MINKSSFIGRMVTVSILIAGVFYLSACEKRASVYNLEIAESENIWRVFDEEGNDRGTLEVRQNDRINWQAVGSDLEFRFDVDVNNYFEFERGLFADSMTQAVSDGEELNLLVKSDAPLDTLEYQVYVAIADTFVVGNSPPVIIIKSRK